MEENLRNIVNAHNIMDSDETIINEFDIDMTLKGFDAYRITDKTIIKPPVPVIKINGEIISSEGNITTISGASKSGKSSFVNILIAGAISTDGNIDGLEAIKVEPNTNGKAVIHFDTELSLHDHQLNLISILNRSSIITCPDYFLSYNIREWGVLGTIDVVETVCRLANEEFNGIHLIVFDGAADFLNDVNDPIQSNELVKRFGDIANTFNAPLIVIIHTNPGSDKERGHLGSQFQRKSESVLFVRNHDDVSSLEPKLLRKALKNNIPSIQFVFDKSKGYHVEYKSTAKQAALKGAKKDEDIKLICSNIFNDQKKYKYGEAIDLIKDLTNKADVTAKETFAIMKKFKIIEQDVQKYWKLSE